MATNISTYNALAFNQGIIPMDDAARPAANELPPQSKITPANLAYIAQVDQILSPDGGQKMLRDWVRPVLDKAELLEPGVFSELLQSSVQSLKNLKNIPPDHASRLKNATYVLEDHAQLRDFSLMMTMALFEG
jgi:hypothetical protein